MKKTLTVNLGGTVFAIDEDAYQLLDKYLSNIRAHFSKDDDADEIMNDFELRISELFSERIRLGYEVITIVQVEEVIKRMGSPEEIFEGEASAENSDGNVAAGAGASVENGEEVTGKKKLMRDPDDKILGGVCSGLAAYFGWDVVALRLIFIVLFFVPYFPIVAVYLLFWIVMPQATTAADKLRMRGENITIENIGKTVTSSFEHVNNKVNDYVNSGQSKNSLRNIADTIVSVVGFLIKILAIIIGVVALPVLGIILFVLFVVAVALFGGASNAIMCLPFIPFDGSLLTMLPTWLYVTSCIGIILTIGIPVVAMIYALCVQFFHIKAMSTPSKWVLLVLWLIGVALTVVGIVNIHSMLPYMSLHNVYFS